MQKAILFIIILMFLTTSSCLLNRTSENALLQQFDFDISNFKYEILTDKEEWNPNGDGYRIITIKLNSLNKDNFKYIHNQNFITLPISNSLPANEIPLDYRNSKKGYYKYHFDKDDERDFEILIIDTIKKELLLYYQIE